MAFQALPPGLAAHLIRDIADELTPLVEARSAFFERTPCGRCGSAMEPAAYAPRMFTPDTPLPRTVARCVECGYIIDPHTNLVLDTGDPRKVEDALPLIRGK